MVGCSGAGGGDERAGRPRHGRRRHRARRHPRPGRGDRTWSARGACGHDARPRSQGTFGPDRARLRAARSRRQQSDGRRRRSLSPVGRGAGRAGYRQRAGRSCVWVLGHSEGALVALQAAQAPAGICGLILVSGGGRPIGTVMRDQLRASPANAPILAAALATIDALEAGRRVPAVSLPAPIRPLFADKVQPYLIDLMSHDPARLIAAVKLPVLIVQGERDLQVSVEDAKLLKAAPPAAPLVLVPGVNHVLRHVASDGRAAHIATYVDAGMAIDPAVPAAVAGFLKK